MNEKPLYQIAVERIFDRFAKSDAGVKNEIIFFLRQKAWTTKEREAGIAYMVRNLFPELNRNCVAGCFCKKDGGKCDSHYVNGAVVCRVCGCIKQS